MLQVLCGTINFNKYLLHNRTVLDGKMSAGLNTVKLQVWPLARNIPLSHIISYSVMKLNRLNGIVHPKKCILSKCTHYQKVLPMYECLCSAEHKGRYFEECFLPGCFGAPLTEEKQHYVNGAPELLCFPLSLEYLPLCSAEKRHSYRFGTTWGRVNNDRIFIFGWTIPLRLKS